MNKEEFESKFKVGDRVNSCSFGENEFITILHIGNNGFYGRSMEGHVCDENIWGFNDHDWEIYEEPKQHFNDPSKIDCVWGDLCEANRSEIIRLRGTGRVQMLEDEQWITILSLIDFFSDRTKYRLKPKEELLEEWEYYFTDLSAQVLKLKEPEVSVYKAKTGRTFRRIEDGKLELVS